VGWPGVRAGDRASADARGYDRWAAIYDGEDNPLVLLEEQHLIPLLGDVRGLDVVDLGCGTGRHAVPLCGGGRACHRRGLQ